MPNPVGSGLPNEASYTDGGDGTVVDDVTGLVWQQQAPDGDFTWQEAIDYCDTLDLGGRSDWRLPSRIEMTSIVDYSRSGTKVDSTAFPGAPGGFFKTASEWILSIDGRSTLDVAWAFNVSDGIVSNNYDKSNPGRVRCVASSGEGEAPGEEAQAPPSLYTALDDEQVQDNYTGLIWQRLDSDVGMSWQEAVDYCAGLSLGGSPWRLPTIREAATLVDEATVAPSIDEEMFPNTKYGSRSDNWYWASHRAVGSETAAWAINHDDGFTGFNAGSSGAWNYFTSAFARCVR